MHHSSKFGKDGTDDSLYMATKKPYSEPLQASETFDSDLVSKPVESISIPPSMYHTLEFVGR